MSKKSRWQRSPRLQEEYGRQLRHVAKEVARIVSGFDPENLISQIATMPVLDDALRRYSEILAPWAESIAARMADKCDRQDKAIWATIGRSMGAALRHELESAGTGEFQRQWMREQVTLIKSLPLDASLRVHGIVLEGQMESIRFEEVARRIMETQDVTQARATLIARTEVARAATLLTQTRAESVGSEEYVWMTANDGDVRESHRELNGKIFRWDTPPEHREGGGRVYRSHPGCIFNCRCAAIPQIPGYPMA